MAGVTHSKLKVWIPALKMKLKKKTIGLGRGDFWGKPDSRKIELRQK